MAGQTNFFVGRYGPASRIMDTTELGWLGKRCKLLQWGIGLMPDALGFAAFYLIQCHTSFQQPHRSIRDKTVRKRELDCKPR